jgi:DNA polymerase-3 subunit delta'
MAYSTAQALNYLKKAHRNDRLAHAFLFTGPEGSGKRGLVTEFFQAVNGESTDQSDLHSVEPESKTRKIVVEQVRHLEAALRMRSHRASTKFGVIYDADRLVPQASNSFLKTLEEPPANSVLILVTALPESLIDTVRSRCIQVQLRPPPYREPTPEEVTLLQNAAAILEKHGFSIVSALRVAGAFQEALNLARERIESEHDELLKKDQAAYKQATDGKWLEQREERLAVLSESRYTKARENLVLRMIEWFGDAIRIQQSGAYLDLPAFREESSRLAGRSATSELVSRIEGLQALVGYFSRNLQERMAIEVAFIQAFGKGAPR